MLSTLNANLLLFCYVINNSPMKYKINMPANVDLLIFNTIVVNVRTSIGELVMRNQLFSVFFWKIV